VQVSGSFLWSFRQPSRFEIRHRLLGVGLEGIVSKAQRTVQVGAIKGVAENQESESASGYEGH
jgi:hypothetical protein